MRAVSRLAGLAMEVAVAAAAVGEPSSSHSPPAQVAHVRSPNASPRANERPNARSTQGGSMWNRRLQFSHCCSVPASSPSLHSEQLGLGARVGVRVGWG